MLKLMCRHGLAAALLGAVLAAGAASTPALAFDLRPIMVQLAPQGAQASQTVIVRNTHAVPIAVQASVFKRTQNPDGSDTLVPADDDFIILPPQMAVGPGASQSVRVRWIGDAAPAQELAYRLVVEQVPVNLGSRAAGADERQAQVDVRYRYEAALYIVPKGSQPDARLVAAREAVDQDGQRRLELRIANEGTRRAILDSSALVLTFAGMPPITLEGNQLGALNALNVLAGSERVVSLPWPENMPSGNVEGQLQTQYILFD
ncbi:fimbria/pilus periplasmic chaperone [Croceicoccus sp. F390]|uniref:Fimbria/pilus periplasmic chaperone n=1 Tax=Croceicoccus esteveae TaxID=3075597 RepID=A0ABU2ZG84_9SPHN|nr:fimbria/pilus periplasmic chaperone [Croceicoccus sp. F390]MDT0575604.1 fimbria/pilus periplasmic chaperone [Croceicoccus sp. F390]